MTRTFITAAAAVVALGMTSATAQEATTFDLEYDAETGAAFDDFNASFDEWGAYDRFDADGDGMVTREEYNRGVFDMYDVDRDGMLSDDEVVGMQEERLFADETVKAGGATTETQD